MGKRKRGGAAKPVVRLTAARYVSEQYGEKGLRALKAMGPVFAAALQDEILHGRRRNELLDRKIRLEKALEDLSKKIADMGGYTEDMGSCIPRLEAVVKALPDIVKETPKADEPKAKEPEGEPAEVSAQS